MRLDFQSHDARGCVSEIVLQILGIHGGRVLKAKWIG